MNKYTRKKKAKHQKYAKTKTKAKARNKAKTKKLYYAKIKDRFQKSVYNLRKRVFSRKT
jgi:hypothetical protein